MAKAIQGLTALLASDLVTTSTEIVVKNFKDIYGKPITKMAGNKLFLTLEPRSESNQEIVSFTGIQVVDSIKTKLTGVTRGLKAQPDAVTGLYDADPALAKPHSANSEVIITDTPQFWEDKADKDSITIPDLYIFNTLPKTAGTLTATDPKEFVTLHQIQSMISAVDTSSKRYLYTATYSGQNSAGLTFTITHGLNKVPRKVHLSVKSVDYINKTFSGSSEGEALITDNGNNTGTVSVKKCNYLYHGVTPSVMDADTDTNRLSYTYMPDGSWRAYKINSVTNNTVVIGNDVAGGGNTDFKIALLFEIVA